MRANCWQVRAHRTHNSGGTAYLRRDIRCRGVCGSISTFRLTFTKAGEAETFSIVATKRNRFAEQVVPRAAPTSQWRLPVSVKAESDGAVYQWQQFTGDCRQQSEMIR